MKKILCVAVVFLLLFSTFAGAAEMILPREEIPLAQMEAEGLQKLGFLEGTENGLELERSVTRAEAVTMIARISGLAFDDLGYLTPAFSDIDGHWAEDIIEKFYHAGLVNGVSETNFEPERTVSGKEFVKILLSAMGFQVTSLEQVYELGKEADLLNNNFVKSVVYNDEALLRSDVARLCFGALSAKVASGEMLFKRHIANGQYKQSDFEGILWSVCPAPPKSFSTRINEQMPQDKNYMFSPLSIKMALALAANGADGETKQEIINAIGVEDLDEFNAYVKGLMETYTKTDLIKLNVANSIWLNLSRCGSMRFDSNYQKTIFDFYNGEAKDVTNDNAVEEVNKWVNEKTNGKIPSIVDNNEFWAYLVNAVYFKADWTHQFREEDTKKDVFTDRNGEEKQIDFMNQTAHFNYFKNDSLQIVELPYSNSKALIDENGSYTGTERHDDLSVSMFVIMPKEGRITYPEQLLKDLKSESAYLDLSMPKFKTEFSTSLNDMLKVLGIQTAFDKDKADFRKMVTQENLFISDTIHKTFINVDENGTEAAAVTGIGMAGSGMPPEPVSVKIDRPFTYVIRDNISGEILFMGEYAFAE